MPAARFAVLRPALGASGLAQGPWSSAPLQKVAQWLISQRRSDCQMSNGISLLYPRKHLAEMVIAFLRVPYRSWGFGVSRHEMSKWLKEAVLSSTSRSCRTSSSRRKSSSSNENEWFLDNKEAIVSFSVGMCLWELRNQENGHRWVIVLVIALGCLSLFKFGGALILCMIPFTT